MVVLVVDLQEVIVNIIWYASRQSPSKENYREDTPIYLSHFIDDHPT